MSRTSRRKTLSHSEIENFLSEINVDNGRQTFDCSKDSIKTPASSIGVNDTTNTTEENIIAAVVTNREIQLVRDFCKVEYCL
jgi:hypothetical protein